MKIDGKEILKRLKAESNDREKISFYLSRSLYDKFKEACGGVPIYRVLEELIREFNASIKGGK